MRFDPFRDLDRLSQSMWGGESGRRTNGMPFDAYRDGDTFLMHFDMPGVDPSTIELTVEKNVLTVSAERRHQWAEGVDLIVNERPSGSFTRQLFLGETLDADSLRASSDNGVLTITIPVAEKAKPRKVEIGHGAGAGGDHVAPIEAPATA